LLIKAFEIVKRRIEDSELWLVGYGDAKVIKNGIKVFGKVDDKKKKNLLSKAWVSVSASMKEGWGITVIEANACGTPCIAYDVPGLRDSIIDGKTGFLIKEDGDVEKLAEAIIRILENGSLRRKLSKNALEWSKEFSWDKSAKEFLKVVGNTSDL
jgi:glycosyltransferase involved in cell wall biosynthesis